MPLLPEDADLSLRGSGPQKALTLYEQNDLTQAEIADLLGYSQPTVARWIKAEREKREAREQQAAERRSRLSQGTLIAMRIVFIACTMAVTTAICWIAWAWH